MRNVPSHP
jgi:hypothetical protein